MSTVKGSTTIKYIRQGDTLQTSLRADKPLVQYLKKGTTTVMPDWTVPVNQPVIYPVVRSSLTDARVSPTADSEEWKMNGTVIPFAGNLSAAFGQVPAGTFRKERRQMDGDTSVPVLTLCKNLTRAGETYNALIEFSAMADTGFAARITASIDIRLEEIDGDPYVGYIAVNDGGVIDDNTDSLTLTANLMKGGSAATEPVSYRWYKANGNTWTDTGKTGKSVTVTGDDIDTQELYKVDFVISGTVMASATLPVYDERDELVIVPNPDGAEEVSSARPQVKYTPVVVKRGDTNRTPVAGYSFEYLLTDSRYRSIATGQGATFSVTLQHAIAASGDLSLIISAAK